MKKLPVEDENTPLSGHGRMLLNAADFTLLKALCGIKTWGHPSKPGINTKSILKLISYVNRFASCAK
jgi:hypothetical protein